MDPGPVIRSESYKSCPNPQGIRKTSSVEISSTQPKQRGEFLKYEVPVIDFDLEAGDPRLKDVFHRLNRTYYSLSAIEKLASEYSASEFMLVARVLSGEISNSIPDNDELAEPGNDEEDVNALPVPDNIFNRDPGVGEDTWNWLLARRRAIC